MPEDRKAYVESLSQWYAKATGSGAWYSEEYRGCGNGHYYFAMNANSRNLYEKTEKERRIMKENINGTVPSTCQRILKRRADAGALQELDRLSTTIPRVNF